MISRKLTLFLILSALLQVGVIVAALSLVERVAAIPEVASLRAIGGDLRRAEDLTLYVSCASLSILVVVALTVRSTIRRSLRRFSAAVPDANGGIVVDTDQGDELDSVARIINEVTAGAASVRTRQREEDDARVKGEQFTQQVVGAMFDIVIVTDQDFRIVMANRAACELLGYSKLELIGSNIEDIFEAPASALSVTIRQLLLQNEMRDNDMTYRARSGRLVPALVSAATLRNPNGAPAAIITVGKDITTRKQLERDLLEAKVAAEAANRAKSAFVANMSHEIRTPMTAILGYADLLLRPDPSAEQRRLWLETIGRNGRHLLSVINDILDVSKIEAGRMSTERIECSTLQIISDVAALMRERAADKALRFDVRCTGDIPETIQTDPVRLRQVLINLIGNAIKFTDTGAVQVRVALTDGRDGSPLLQISVIDTGIGLTATQIDSLFKPFMQADSSTTRKFGGTGLGLVITRKLVEMLGGEIGVRSTPKQGSTFTITVATGDLTNVKMLDAPVIDVNAAVTGNARQIDVIRPAKLSGSVLLAEDGADNRALICFYLKEAGFDVTTVENGLLAVERANEAERRGKPFDVILMDMQMPELDGYSAATRLRQQDYRRPIIALTAHSLEGDRDKCIAAGCDDYAVKPIDQAALFATIAKYIHPEGSAPAVEPSPASPQNAPATRPVSAKLLTKFLGGLSARMATIESAAMRKAFAEVHTLAHQLKGASGGYGFPEMGDQAGRLEAAAAASDADAIDAAVAALKNAAADAMRRLPSLAA